MMFGFRAGYLGGSAIMLRPGANRARVYIAPTASGDQSGSSWANAAPLTALNSRIGLAAALGGDVWLRADVGDYTLNQSLSIAHGGATGNPVVVRGVDVNGNDMLTRIVGDRANPWTVGQAKGVAQNFRLQRGSDNLTFQFIGFKNQGYGCIVASAPIANLTITDCYFEDVQSPIDNTAHSPETDATVTNWTVQRCVAHGYSKSFFRARYHSGPGLVEDCIGDSMEQDGDNFASGCVLDGTLGIAQPDGNVLGCHDWVYRRCTMSNSRDTLNSYQNGDGFATEGQDYNVTYEYCVSFSNSDGGFDCKSRNTIFSHCHAYDNKRNWRIWGDAVATDCIAENPNKRGGIGAPCQISTFHQGYLRWYGGCHR